jgi:hypothetical protein
MPQSGLYDYDWESGKPRDGHLFGAGLPFAPQAEKSNDNSEHLLSALPLRMTAVCDM